MEEFLKKIGINNDFTYSEDGCLIIDFENDNQWSKAYTLLDRCDLIEEDEDSSNVTYGSSTIQYVNEDFTITLLGDLEGEKYRLVMREN